MRRKGRSKRAHPPTPARIAWNRVGPKVALPGNQVHEGLGERVVDPVRAEEAGCVVCAALGNKILVLGRLHCTRKEQSVSASAVARSRLERASGVLSSPKCTWRRLSAPEYSKNICSPPGKELWVPPVAEVTSQGSRRVVMDLWSEANTRVSEREQPKKNGRRCAHDRVELARAELLVKGREGEHRSVARARIVGKRQARHHIGAGRAQGVPGAVLCKPRRVVARDVAAARHVAHDEHVCHRGWMLVSASIERV